MTSASPLISSALHSRVLDTGWSLSVSGGPAPEAIARAAVPASVPGCVHTDLLAAGLIPDPFLDDNESALAWIGLVDWTYRTTFGWSSDGHTRHDLVFHGVDTVAAIELNGAVLAEVANQHRTYRVDVHEHLIDGENELVVSLRSPIRYANAQALVLGTRPRPYPFPYDAIRKSACSFGWDWGIATATSGLVGVVRLESWSVARLAEVRVAATPAGEGGVVDVTALIEWASRPGTAGGPAGGDAGPAPGVSVSVAVDGPGLGGSIPSSMVAVDGDIVRVRVALDAVRRWWPAGHGDQSLYVVDVRLHAGDVVAATHRRVGFRDVRWDTTPDTAGAAFALVVNDRPVFVKGVNWIPDDALTVRVTREQVRDRFQQALDANLNLVRVWGGGLYESDDFYDLADEMGLLTWQDFLFACAAYAEEEPLRSEIEAEARENIVRLAHHASLVLMTGNNEALEGFEDWGWNRRLDGKTWGAQYYYELFPSLIAELAPHLAYIPGSPFSRGMGWEPASTPGAPSGSQTGPHPLDPGSGTVHLWRQWNDRDWTTYRESTPRFVAEFGWQGPPTWTTLTRAIGDDPLTPESPGMVVHQKAADGNSKLTVGLLPHYRLPEDMETWHWAMQLNQANAVACALTWFRAHAPHTMGAIVWQLNDCWPVTSWAAIDGDGREKPLYFALKNSFAPRAVTIQPLGRGLSAIVANDTAEVWSTDLVITRRSFSGAALAEQRVAVEIAPFENATVRLEAAVGGAGEAASELIVADAAGARGVWFFAEPRDSALAAARTAVAVTQAEGGVDVTVTAEVLVRDLTLLVDKVAPDARVDSGLVTLLPGESHTFRVRGAVVDSSRLAASTVLRSGNQLVGA